MSSKIKSLSKRKHLLSKTKKEKKNYRVSKKRVKDLHILENQMKQKHIDNYERYLKQYLENTNYEIYNFLGRGAYGSVFLICNKFTKTNCKAIKLQILKGYSDELMFEKEVQMQNNFYKHNLTVKVYHHELIRLDKLFSLGIIIMETIDGTLSDFLSVRRDKEILDTVLIWISHILNIMCKYNLIHADMNIDNIAYVISDKGSLRPVIIDFGFASVGKCKPYLELLQILNTLNISERNIYFYNYIYLETQLMEIIKDEYPYIKTRKDVSKLYGQLSKKYMRSDYTYYLYE